MSLVPDITAGTGAKPTKPALVALWGCRSRKEHTRWPFPSMGFFAGGPAIWELADPRSTLRQVGGTVEILVLTATLATFRDAGFTPPIQSRPPPGSVGKRCTTREDLLLRTGGRVLHHLKPKCRPLPATAMLGLAQYAIQHALAFSQ